MKWAWDAGAQEHVLKDGDGDHFAWVMPTKNGAVARGHWQGSSMLFKGVDEAKEWLVTQLVARRLDQ